MYCIWLYSYGVSLPLIWACRHLSGAACVYIPPSILRLPYSSHLSYIVVFILGGGNKTRGLDPFIFSIKDSLHIHRWYGTFYYRDTTAYIMTIPSSPCSNVVWRLSEITAWLSSHICVLTALLSFAWTALRAVRILPVLSISTGGLVQISFHQLFI